MNGSLRVLRFLLNIGIIVGLRLTDAQGQSQKVPEMDGGAGRCSLELAVTGPDARPVYAAIVKVHIVYGFAGIRRLDLEAGTNSDGKVKFTGLPEKVHRPPLEFNVSKDDLVGQATFDPISECHAKRNVTIRKGDYTQKPKSGSMSDLEIN